MGLAQYQPPTASVPLGGDNKMLVRGLGLTDITKLVTDHLPDVRAVYLTYEQHKQSIFSKSSMDGFLLQICRTCPDVVAEVISVAVVGEEAKEEDLLKQAQKLHFAVQVAALTEIFKLTFEDAGGLKNLYALLRDLMNEVLPEDARAALRVQLTKTQ